MGTELSPTRRDLQTRLIEKAWKEPTFKTEVLANPKGMLEKYLGRKLPEDLKVVVHEEDANTLHFAIPLPPSNVAELSDNDLEKVAGGTDVAIASLIATAAGALAAGGLAGGAVTGALTGW